MKDINFFLERIEKRTTKDNESLGECWIWTGAYDGEGRPVYCDRSEKKRNRSAHREIFKLVKMASLPDGVHHPVLHKCIDQKKCINPDHLYYRSPTETPDGPTQNRIDAVEQKRIPLRKLKGQEEQIVKLFKEGVEQQEIAKRLGVNPKSILRFLNGRTNQNNHNYVKEAEEQRDILIKKLYSEGLSVTQIALQAKTTDTVIYKIVPEIRNRPKGTETQQNKEQKKVITLEERKKQIKEMKTQGKSAREIALYFGISIPLVYTILKQE
jgi:DNA-binding CsgD family transcriptional regulator